MKNCDIKQEKNTTNNQFNFLIRSNIIIMIKHKKSHIQLCLDMT